MLIANTVTNGGRMAQFSAESEYDSLSLVLYNSNK